MQSAAWSFCSVLNLLQKSVAWLRGSHLRIFDLLRLTCATLETAIRKQQERGFNDYEMQRVLLLGRSSGDFTSSALCFQDVHNWDCQYLHFAHPLGQLLLFWIPWSPRPLTNCEPALWKMPLSTWWWKQYLLGTTWGKERNFWSWWSKRLMNYLQAPLKSFYLQAISAKTCWTSNVHSQHL